MFRKARRSWRLFIVAIVTALAVMATSTVALANEPGESNTWKPELVNGANMTSQDTVSEAYGASGNLISIWRGGSDNHVWLASDNGQAFNVDDDDTTQTYVAPRVIYSNGWFYAFQTGTDGSIYWSRVADNGNTGWPGGGWTPWVGIPGNYTEQSVSVASSPSGILMVYRGDGADTNMYSTWLPVGSTTWTAAAAIGLQSPYAPTVTFNPRYEQFVAAFAGLNDNRVYLTTQDLGSPNWSNALQYPSVTTLSSPVIASQPDGSMLISVRSAGSEIWLQSINQFGGLNGWAQESQHWASNVAPFLSVANGIMYMLLTGLNSQVWWKPVYNG